MTEDLVWRMFEKTGSISSYLFYKALCQINDETADPDVREEKNLKKGKAMPQ